MSNQERLILWLKAYSFGDRFLSDSFRRAANDAIATTNMRCKCFKATARDAINFAFPGTIPFDRPILQCLAIDFCFRWHDDNHEYYSPQVKMNCLLYFLVSS